MTAAPIGILGGTFDPIHHGHLRIALEVLEALELAELRFLPSATPPHRDAPSRGARQRAELVAAAIASEPRFSLDTRELDRDGPSYMVDTLASLRHDLGPDQPLCLLLGTDAFAGLPSWHDWQRLIDLAHLVVAQRPEAALDGAAFPAGWMDLHTARQIDELHQAPSGRLWRQSVTQLDISASDIRARLASGRSARYLVPDRVLDLIHSQPGCAD